MSLESTQNEPVPGPKESAGSSGAEDAMRRITDLLEAGDVSNVSEAIRQMAPQTGDTPEAAAERRARQEPAAEAFFARAAASGDPTLLEKIMIMTGGTRFAERLGELEAARKQAAEAAGAREEQAAEALDGVKARLGIDEAGGAERG